MLERRRETAKRYILGIGRGDLPDELFAPDFSGWSGLSGDIPGPVLRERTLMMSRIFPAGLTFEIFDSVAENDLVAVRAASSGTLFDGTPYTNDYCFHFQFDGEDRILKVREYMNVQVAAEVIRPAFAKYLKAQAAPAEG